MEASGETKENAILNHNTLEMMRPGRLAEGIMKMGCILPGSEILGKRESSMSKLYFKMR